MSNKEESCMIWILNDRQSKATGSAMEIVEKLGCQYFLKDIYYNWQITLPQFIKRKNPLKFVNRRKSDDLEALPLPKVIISTTYNSALAALGIKENLQKKIFLMHIGKLPNDLCNEFDVVLLSKEEASGEMNSRSNVIETIGDFSQITPELLKREAEGCNSIFVNFPDPKIALFVEDIVDAEGEDRVEKATKMARLVSDITNRMKGSLLVSIGKNIDLETRRHIKDNLSCTNYFYYQGDSAGTKHGKLLENHYLLPYLALAKYVIIVGDSLPICSKCCSTGKPVYIYDEKFIDDYEVYQMLVNDGYIKKLNYDVSKLEDSKSLILNEVKRVTELLKGIFLI